MTVCLVSMANAHEKQVGGKHIHQLLLEKAFREDGLRCVSIYPQRPSLPKRVWNRLSRYFGQGKSNSRGFIRYCNDIRANLSHQIRQQTELHSSDPVVYLAQDTISALAIKDVLCRDERQSDRVCLTLHGYFTREELNYQDFGDDRDEFIASSMGWERESAAFVDHLITVDSRIREYAIAELGVDGPKIQVMFNAINDPLFAPANRTEILELRARLNVPLDRPVMLVARRLVKKNGVHQAIAAMAKLGDTGILMLVLGNGPERENLENQIAELGLAEHVDMRGEVPHGQIVDYYRAADIILLPSTRSDNVEEATSLSMLEGMACEKTVIVSAIGGMKEVIKDGVNGYLFEDKNIPDLAGKIHHVLTHADEAARVARAASAHAREHHGYRNHAKAYLAFAAS